MPLERDALTLAMRQFGEDFDAVKWRAAYEALSAPERNRVVQVTANLTALIDNAVELVRFAATLTASAWPRTSIARGRKGLMLARSSMTTAARPVPATSRNFLLADALEETKAPND